MNKSTTSSWFQEVFSSAGTAFSLEIEAQLHSEKTPYQTIDIYQTTTFGKLMVLDGCIMLSERDNFLYHEMMTHPGLFTHPDPKNIIIIGGGDCGTLKETLKHKSVQRVVQIEIDQRVTKLSEQYFPALCSANQDKRAELKFEDGVKWIKSQAPETWDIIIVDSTDPVGPAKALFSTEFFQACFQCLTGNGLLVQQSESPILHAHSIIKDLHTDLKQAGFPFIHTLPFPQPVYPSGWWSATIASKNVKPTAYRKDNARNKPFNTLYYNQAIHEGALAQPEFMKQILN